MSSELVTKDNGSTTDPIQKYGIEKKIGQGQFSCVYKAKSIITGEIVALKRVPVIFSKWMNLWKYLLDFWNDGP